VAITATAGVLGLLGWLVNASGAGGWMAQAMRHRTFVIAAGIFLASGLGLVAICHVMYQAGAPYRNTRRSECGSVTIEFAIALPIALMLVLLMTQAALLMGGNICVHYAAYCAARSAIVQIPSDLSSAEPPNVLDAPGAAKMDSIRDAAIWALMPVSCSNRDYPSGDDGGLASGVRSFMTYYGSTGLTTGGSTGGGWYDRADLPTYLGRKRAYAEDHTEITMYERTETDGTAEYLEIEYPHVYEPRDEIRVEVKHTLYLSVPYAARVLAAVEGGTKLGFAPGEYGMEITARVSLTNEGVADYVEVETFD
jgi:hypothetical protein